MEKPGVETVHETSKSSQSKWRQINGEYYKEWLRKYAHDRYHGSKEYREKAKERSRRYYKEVIVPRREENKKKLHEAREAPKLTPELKSAV